MARVLISTVGGRQAPLVTAVRENAPLDLVVFLGSGGKPRAASAGTVRCATTRESHHLCPHCGQGFVERVRVVPAARAAGLVEGQFSIERVEDPDDLGQVLAACERIEAAIEARWPRCEATVIANYTGGTKTMSLGLALHALRRAGRGWRLQLNRPAPGGRTDLIAVRAGDHAVWQDSSRELAEAAERWARELAEGHDYAGAVIVLSRVLARQRLRSEDQGRLLALSRRCRLWVARECGDYGEALELARQAPELEELYGPRLRLLLRIVAALGAGGRWPDPALDGLELVDEVREAAERSAARGRFAEALGGLARAAGLLAQLRLRRDGDPLAAGDGEQETARAVPPGLWTAYERLAERRDALGRYFLATRGELSRLVAVWWSSASGRGVEPVGRETWLAVAPRWRRWLDGALEVL